MKFSFLVLFSLWNLLSYSQALQPYVESTGNLLIKQSDPFRMFHTEPVDGSPYHLSDSFTVSSVYTHSHRYKEVQLRYNIYHELFEFKNQNEVYAINPRIDIKKVITPLESYWVHPFEENNKIKMGFFIQLDSGAITLLQRKRMRIEPKAETKGYESEIKNARYIKTEDMYYVRIGSHAAKFFTSIKKLIELLPEAEASKLQTFIKEKKIKYNIKDLTTLFAFYNSKQKGT